MSRIIFWPGATIDSTAKNAKNSEQCKKVDVFLGELCVLGG
jgi:hypothetical protein